MLEYNGHTIKMDRNPKFLGVTLDPGLHFCKYAETIRERASRRINILRRIRGKSWGASTKLITSTYNCLVRPIIDYMPFINLSMSNTNYMKLERIQRSAARAATQWPIKTNTTIIYARLGLETVRNRAWKQTDTYMCKALVHNDLIRILSSTYLVAEQLNEGSHLHHSKKPRPTILGLIKNNTNLECTSKLLALIPNSTSINLS